ncbi:MAG TPA: hypothetical protein VJ914_12830 [Pseudonocardiaceae bacterium]|nr:hypothetical protein [Pseudonocardiaceae bacterium]
MDERSNGRDLRELAARWQGDPAFDEAFEENVRRARLAADQESDSDPWLD